MIKNKNGFTLVEIIVVIVIIAILTAIAAPIYLKFIDEAKKSVAESNASTMYTQINLLLSINDSQDAMTKDIMKWIKQGGEIIYKGVNDNSVTKPVGYHDDAKRAIQKILGGDPLEMGYRISFLKSDSSGTYAIKELKIFYKKPSNAAINSSKPDFIL